MGRNWVLTVDFRSFVSVVFVEGETKCGDDDDQMGCVDWMVVRGSKLKLAVLFGSFFSSF